jgi:sugar/nucleoside kinase (ribokinase family)
MRTLCLGEALVDLVCEQHVERIADAPAFAPHFGGAVANVAVNAARCGAVVSLAGGCGDDPWGHWLRDRLEDEGVGLEPFVLDSSATTPLAFVTIDHAGEPSYLIYGSGIAAGIRAAADGLDDAVDTHDALFFTSNSLVGDERILSMRARERALAAGKPVVFDPNLRLHRWSSVDEAIEASRACLPGATVVKANRDEARLLTGEDDPEQAAAALVSAGAVTAIVTLGPEGAVARGPVDVRVPGTPATVVSTVGAGDAFSGVVIAHLARAGYDLNALEAAMVEAVEVGARATERWSAV